MRNITTTLYPAVKEDQKFLPSLHPKEYTTCKRRSLIDNLLKSFIQARLIPETNTKLHRHNSVGRADEIIAQML